jgi:hypothetical protein
MSKPDDIHPPVKVRQPDSRFPVMTYFTDKGKAVALSFRAGNPAHPELQRKRVGIPPRSVPLPEES